MQRGFAPILILVGILIIMAVAGGAYYVGAGKNVVLPPALKACTQEAKQCSDGSYVVRSGLNCEFSSCPAPTGVEASGAPNGDAEAADWKTYTDQSYSFKYPQDATVKIITGNSFITGQEVTNELMITPPEEASNHYIFNITVEDNTQNLNTREVIDNYISSLKSNNNIPGGTEGMINRINKSIKPYTNGNINGLIGTYGWETEFTELVESKNNKIYSFSIHDGNGYTNDYVSKLFDQILSTFKFTQ